MGGFDGDASVAVHVMQYWNERKWINVVSMLNDCVDTWTQVHIINTTTA